MKIPTRYWVIVFAAIAVVLEVKQFQEDHNRGAFFAGLVSLGVFIGIGFVVYKFVYAPVKRRLRSKAEERFTQSRLAGKRIRLFTIEFPELDHLPPEERESLLRRCIEKPEVRRFARISQVFVLFSAAISTALNYFVIADQHWPLLPTIVVSFAVLLMLIVAMIFGVMFAKVRILRKLIKQELENSS